MQGLGPLFCLTVTVQNTSPATPITGYYITFRCDQDLYIIRRKFIEVGEEKGRTTMKGGEGEKEWRKEGGGGGRGGRWLGKAC